MEDENLSCSLPDDVDSSPEQPKQDSGTSAKSQCINGEQGAIVWCETEMQINQSHGTDQRNLSQEAGQESPEEVEQWEQIIWPVRPMTCSSAPLSFATVQWDMPGSSEETPLLMTDSGLANDFDSGGVTSLDSTPPSLHQCEDIIAELFMPEEIGEEDGFDSQFLDSGVDWTGNGCQPCDAEDVRELTTQEKENSNNNLKSKNEIPLRTESEEEEGNSNPSEPVDLIKTLEEIEGWEDEVDSFVDVKIEEEQEEPCVLLTSQGNSEEEETSAKGVETEDKNEEQCQVEEDQSVINVPCTENNNSESISYVSEVEFPVDDSGLTLNSDKLQSDLLEETGQPGIEEGIEIQEGLHEDFTGQTEDPEMCKDEDQGSDLEQSKTVDDKEETLIEVAEPLQRIESTHETLELPEELEEKRYLEQDCDQTASEDREPSPQPESSEAEQFEMIKESEQIQAQTSHQQGEQHCEDSEQLGMIFPMIGMMNEYLSDSSHIELTEHSTQLENMDETQESFQLEEMDCVKVGEPEVAEQQEQEHMETPAEQNEQSPQMSDTCQPIVSEQPDKTVESEIIEQVYPETEVTRQIEEAELSLMDIAKPPDWADAVGDTADGGVQTVVANGEQPKPLETAVPHMNGGEVDREKARHLAERLFNLDGIQRVDVVKHLDKDNNFSRAVGEEYLKFFDFNGQTLDQALRSFLKVVILIGETQERERVLQHFSCRFHQCNPNSFSSSGTVLALTCAVMLLNTDLHGQHVGKSMSSSKFVSNLDGMNESENFSKDLLKGLYNSIKNEPLEWAVDDDELKSTVLLEEDTVDAALLRSKANPFLDVPHDKNASVVKEGFLQRKLHADIDGKRTPWGRRGWKTFYGVLRGMVLYLQKDDYRRDQVTNEEVVSVHHSLAEQASDYTKKPHVFRLQTADWRVFLFQASSKVEMNSWISRINLVSALHSSPPFPAAVGSQRKFFRPILPASQSAHTLEHQLQSHGRMLESFKADLSYLQQNRPESRKARTKDLEEHRIRAEYLHHEMSRYETYIQVLEGWKKVEKSGNNLLSPAELVQFDKAMCAGSVEDVDGEDGGLKKSYSSPSLEVDIPTPIVIKVKRNISERRTYRRTIVPRGNKEA